MRLGVALLGLTLALSIADCGGGDADPQPPVTITADTSDVVVLNRPLERREWLDPRELNEVEVLGEFCGYIHDGKFEPAAEESCPDSADADASPLGLPRRDDPQPVLIAQLPLAGGDVSAVLVSYESVGKGKCLVGEIVGADDPIALECDIALRDGKNGVTGEYISTNGIEVSALMGVVGGKKGDVVNLRFTDGEVEPFTLTHPLDVVGKDVFIVLIDLGGRSADLVGR
jgi:hypothetical protein